MAVGCYVTALCLLCIGGQIVSSETTTAVNLVTTDSERNPQLDLGNIFQLLTSMYDGNNNGSVVDLGRIFQQLIPMIDGSNNGSAINFGGLFQQLMPLISGNGGNVDISNLINMLSSQILDKCSQDSVELLNDLTTFKMWALQMVDASGKPSRNLLQGNNIWFGSYDDCLKIHHTVPGNTEHVIDGAYARIYIKLPPNVTAMFSPGKILGGLSVGLRWDLCVPKSCSSDQIASVLNITQLKSLGLSVSSVDFVGPKSIEGDTAAYFSIAILGCFVLLCIIGTVWDVIQDKFTIISKTSEYPNDSGGSKQNGVHVNEITITSDKTQLGNGSESNEKQGVDNPSFTTADQLLINGFSQSNETSQPNGTSQSNGTSQPNGNSQSNGTSQPNGTSNSNGISQPNGIPQSNGISQPNGISKSNGISQANACEANSASNPKPQIPTLSRIVLAFSARQNGRKLLNCSAPPGSLGCLNGIRVLSMAWVILGHFFLILMNQVENKKMIWTMSKTFWFQVILNGTLSVDTFFFLSGLLVSYLFIREVKKIGKISLKQMGLFYFHRYWRLTPLYMIVIMIYTNISTYFNEGPMETPITQGDTENCVHNWWTNLLYINNLYKSGEYEMCMTWSWYLANDMQFYIVSPLAIVPLALGYHVIGLLVIFGMIAGHIIASGYIGWDIGDPGLFTNNPERHFNEFYIKPYTRMGVYAIGLLLGYIINRTKGKLHIPGVVLFVGTLVACTAGLLVNYLTYDQFIGDHTPWGPDSNIAFQTLFRPVWALALFWLVFVCVHGYGGFVNTILSWEAWIPLSRLTYAAYLIHLIVMTSFGENMRGYGYLTGFYIMNNYIGIFAITYAASFIISVVVEAPFLALEKVMLKR